MDEFDMRDLFAGLAMIGIISKLPFGELDRDEHTEVYETTAFSAYEYADAMLRAREPQETGIAAITQRKKK